MKTIKVILSSLIGGIVAYFVLLLFDYLIYDSNITEEENLRQIFYAIFITCLLLIILSSRYLKKGISREKAIFLLVPIILIPLIIAFIGLFTSNFIVFSSWVSFAIVLPLIYLIFYWKYLNPPKDK